MLLLVLLMEGLVVDQPVGPQAPEDLQPAFAQTPQGAGVVVAFLAFTRVVGLSPRALFTTAVGPQVHGVPQHHIAGPADAGLVDLPALETHWADASLATRSCNTCAVSSTLIPRILPS